MPAHSGDAASLPHELVLQQQFLNQFRIQSMTAAKGGDPALDVAAGQRQVSDQIQGLVPHTLVGESQRVTHRSPLVEDQQVACT